PAGAACPASPRRGRADTTRPGSSITWCETRERSDRCRAHPGGGVGSLRLRRALSTACPDGARVVPPPARLGCERLDRGGVRAGVAFAPELPGRGRRLGAAVAVRHRAQRRPRVRPPERGRDKGTSPARAAHRPRVGGRLRGGRGTALATRG